MLQVEHIMSTLINCNAFGNLQVYDVHSVTVEAFYDLRHVLNILERTRSNLDHKCKD